MTIQLDLTVHESIFKPPETNHSNTGFDCYASNLLQLDEFIQNRVINAYIATIAYNALWSPEYDLFKQIKEFYQKNRDSNYSAKETIKLISDMLFTLVSFEDTFNIYDISAEGKVNIDPSIDMLEIAKCHKEEFLKLILSISIANFCSKEYSKEHIVMMRPAPSSKLSVNAELSPSKVGESGFVDLPKSPDTFSSSVPIYDSFSKIILLFDPSDILINAVNERDIEFAIKVAYYRWAIEQEREIQWLNISVPIIGPKFLERCQYVCANCSRNISVKIIRSIVYTITNEHPRKKHKLRTSKGGNDPQQVRPLDGATAWRRDIDYEFHLHYWLCPGNDIELDSVVYHNDYNMYGKS